MEPNTSKEMQEKLNNLLKNVIAYDKKYKQNHYDNFTFYNEYKDLCRFFIAPIAIIDCNLFRNDLGNSELLAVRTNFAKEFLEILEKRNIDLGIKTALSKAPFYQNFNTILMNVNCSQDKIQLLQYLITIYNINCSKPLNKTESLKILNDYKQKLEEYKIYSKASKQKVLSH